jgi:hypothetical protein
MGRRLIIELIKTIKRWFSVQQPVRGCAEYSSTQSFGVPKPSLTGEALSVRVGQSWF